ncbi:hypothetical protein [Acidihalobacter aeolianus]|uniref:hypothetical protein n=1 Tax=Acidihalobacter aeolianus TaxID=2792603 RepID=UPI0012EAA462|nr:hypothetical protein [Acidihalobacter aeolianus]
MNPKFRLAGVLLGGLVTASYAHASPQIPPAHPAKPDSRIEVMFPPMLKRQTLFTMRLHLQGVAEIQQALASGRFEKAAEIATATLGMSSMHGHQMAEEAKYMPHGMMKLGALMHQRAAEFAISAQDAAATGNLKPPLRALSRMTETCVACHSAYRLK